MRLFAELGLGSGPGPHPDPCLQPGLRHPPRAPTPQAGPTCCIRALYHTTFQITTECQTFPRFSHFSRGRDSPHPGIDS